MNSDKRDKIFAAKEKLHQLTQAARQEEEDRAATLRREEEREKVRVQEENTKKHHINMARLQAERERAQAKKKN